MTHDDTRDPPATGTATHTPGSGTPSYRPEAHGTLSQTPETTTSAETGDALPVIPGYEILGELGQGGMGTVYRAREVAFDRDVAIKLLHPRYRPDSPGTQRFLEEARITGQLQHPAIPPVHHIGTLPDGRPFLAMKLIKGDTLADGLDRKPDNRGRFVKAFAQVCQALAYAHSHKVIHRDLKPSNVMIGAFGEVLVLDWGLAKVLTDEGRGSPEPIDVDTEGTEIRTQREPNAATQAGAVLGTPAYMAPEQAAGEIAKVDERADVFGLGAMLCVILTGKPPYTGPSTDAIRVKAIRGETADALARLDACGADGEMITLCKQCLATDREARPRDAREVAQVVWSHLEAVKGQARQVELERVRSEEQRKRRRVQFVLAGTILLSLVLAVFGVGAVSLWRKAEAARETAEDAKKNLESANNQLTNEKRLTEEALNEALRLKSIAETPQVKNVATGDQDGTVKIRDRERLVREAGDEVLDYAAQLIPPTVKEPRPEEVMKRVSEIVPKLQNKLPRLRLWDIPKELAPPPREVNR